MLVCEEMEPTGVAATGADAPRVALDASARSATRLSPELAARMEQLAVMLLPHADAISEVVNARAIETEPELVDPDDPSTVEAVAHSTHANVGAILSMIAYGVPGSANRPSVGALELFERLADREDGLAVILRGYRIGVAELWQIWARHVSAHVDDAGELAAILAASTSHMLAAVDRVCVDLAEQWAETHRRRSRGLDVSPDELVRAALSSSDTAEEALGKLGYDVAATHLALALPPELDERALAQLASRLRTVARAASVSMRSDAGCVLWLALEAAPDDHLLSSIEDAIDVDATVGVSDPLAGAEGFRAAHRQALDARRVGALRGSDDVTRHGDVALLAVLCADTERARALVARELGPLAEDDEVMDRLRTTLVAYLECGESHVGASQTLFVHQKTVAYRIRQAEQILGRRIADRRVELEAALLLHRAFAGPHATAPRSEV